MYVEPESKKFFPKRIDISPKREPRFRLKESEIKVLRESFHPMEHPERCPAIEGRMFKEFRPLKSEQGGGLKSQGENHHETIALAESLLSRLFARER